jgi:hypothetical protein
VNHLKDCFGYISTILETRSGFHQRIPEIFRQRGITISYTAFLDT